MSAETAALRPLGRLDAMADGQAMAFDAGPGGFTGLFAVRQGDTAVVYVNSCPHIGVPLDWAPGRFLSGDASHIVCATHGATFRITDGMCLQGPCIGETLEKVMITLKDGVIWVPEDAGL